MPPRRASGLGRVRGGDKGEKRGEGLARSLARTWGDVLVSRGASQRRAGKAASMGASASEEPRSLAGSGAAGAAVGCALGRASPDCALPALPQSRSAAGMPGAVDRAGGEWRAGGARDCSSRRGVSGVGASHLRSAGTSPDFMRLWCFASAACWRLSTELRNANTSVSLARSAGSLARGRGLRAGPRCELGRRLGGWPRAFAGPSSELARPRAEEELAGGTASEAGGRGAGRVVRHPILPLLQASDGLPNDGFSFTTARSRRQCMEAVADMTSRANPSMR